MRSIPSANVASCPSAAWGKDFSDGQTMLDPVFNGNNISKQANNNYAELDVPAINDKCVLCHPGNKVGAVLGAVSYKIPVE